MIKKVYLTGPFSTEKETDDVRLAAGLLSKHHGLEVIGSSERKADKPEWSKTIFELNKKGIDEADAVVALYYGNISDSGTAWEIGYAYAAGKPVIVVHMNGRRAVSNLMIHEGSYANVETLFGLLWYDFSKMETRSYTGPMI